MRCSKFKRHWEQRLTERIADSPITLLSILSKTEARWGKWHDYLCCLRCFWLQCVLLTNYVHICVSWKHRHDKVLINQAILGRFLAWWEYWFGAVNLGRILNIYPGFVKNKICVNITPLKKKSKPLKHAGAEAAMATVLRTPHSTKALPQSWSVTGDVVRKPRGKEDRKSTPPPARGHLSSRRMVFPILRGCQKLSWLTAPACKAGVNTDSAFSNRMTGARSFLPMNLSFVGRL